MPRPPPSPPLTNNYPEERKVEVRSLCIFNIYGNSLPDLSYFLPVVSEIGCSAANRPAVRLVRGSLLGIGCPEWGRGGPAVVQPGHQQRRIGQCRNTASSHHLVCMDHGRIS